MKTTPRHALATLCFFILSLPGDVLSNPHNTAIQYPKSHYHERIAFSFGLPHPTRRRKIRKNPAVGVCNSKVVEEEDARSGGRSRRTSASTGNGNGILDTSLKEPDEKESNFGRQNYWNQFYEEEEEFVWYSPWRDIAPFFMELVPIPSVPSETDNIENDDEGNKNNNSILVPPPRVLLPGIGNDSSMVDMYDDGYTHLTAFDYAEEGVECARKFFGDRLLQRLSNQSSDNSSQPPGVDLRVADARKLPYEAKSFDAILEKGTLDAIYLSGGKDKELASEYLHLAIDEFARVICTDGIVMSISAACADAIEAAFASRKEMWEVLRDGSFYMTEEGYSSNNIDATIFAYKRIRTKHS